jgi:hypothetical protein
MTMTVSSKHHAWACHRIPRWVKWLRIKLLASHFPSCKFLNRTNHAIEAPMTFSGYMPYYMTNARYMPHNFISPYNLNYQAQS